MFSDILYEKRIVHRDIQPNNIVYVSGDKHHFRLYDFGEALFNDVNMPDYDEHFDKQQNKAAGRNGVKRYLDDDAASVYRCYVMCGGKPDDEYATAMRKLIGRLYTYTE